MPARHNKELNTNNQLKVLKRVSNMEDMDSIQQAALMLISASPKGILNSDLRIQKLAFLYSKTVGDVDLDEDFDFVPYDLGPYSENLASAIEMLGARGLITKDTRRSEYKTSPDGERIAAQLTGEEPERAEVVKELVRVLGAVNPEDLVAAVYELYPEYTKNSIIVERVRRRKSVDSLIVPVDQRKGSERMVIRSRLGRRVVVSFLGTEIQIEEEQDR